MLQRGSGSVYKWTVDPHETAIWLAVQSMRNEGRRVPGFPEIFDIRLGDREALIQREDVKPLSGREHRTLDPWSSAALQRGSRLMTAGRLLERPEWVKRGRRATTLGLSAPLFRSLRRSITGLRNIYRLEPLDLRPQNLGHGAGRKDSVLLLDPGRSPLETALVSDARGHARRRCPNERALRGAVAESLGKAPSYTDCRIVNHSEMRAVMRGHGWKAAEIDGTAGFHTEPHCKWGKCKPGDILLAEGNEWALLHEMVHATDVVDKELAAWLTEGITEACAQDIAKVQGWDHVPTYPREVQFVRAELSPALKMSIMDMGKLIGSNPDEAGQNFAKALASHRGGAWRKWYKALGPGSNDHQRLRRLLKG